MRFIAPELFEDKPIAKNTETYSLGAIYYYMLTGKEPSRDSL